MVAWIEDVFLATNIYLAIILVFVVAGNLLENLQNDGNNKLFWKKDLSSKSNDGDNSKRLRESSLDDSIANATNKDVFTESLKSEDCVAILYSCIKKLEE